MLHLHLLLNLLPSVLAFSIPQLLPLDVSSLQASNADTSNAIDQGKSLLSLSPTSAIASPLTAPTPSPPPPPQPEDAKKPLCNGHSELCTRQYSNVTHLGAHDSPFVGPLPTDNQNLDIASQLNLGIRFLQGQTHADDNGILNLCHTSCLLRNAGPLADFLKSVTDFLGKNPREVVTLLLTNGDNLPLSKFDAAFTASGAWKYAFTPPSSAQGQLALGAWPTLAELIDNQTRLIVFLDTGADTSGKTAPYILDEFTHFFETPYDTTDPSFAQCKLDRPVGSKPDGKMYIVNHFLDANVGFGGLLAPNKARVRETNAKAGNGSIQGQIELCEGLYERAPWGVLVDFIDQGDVMRAQGEANGL